MKSNINKRKLIVVMAGGLNADLTLPSYVLDRCEYVKKKYDRENYIIIASSSFSMNLKPKERDNRIISEASVIYDYLANKIKNAFLGCEQFSHDTIGSIYFCMEFYTKKMNIKEVTFITSDFHSTRVGVILSTINHVVYKNKLIADVIGVRSNVESRKRKSKEKESIENFKKNYSCIKSEKKFLEKLLFEHTNYNNKYCSEVECDQTFLY